MSDPRDIITAAIQAHEDGTMRVVDRTWHAFCDCGTDLGDTMGPLVDSSSDPAGRLHQKHLGEAIRAALAAAGLLVQPGGETRFEWRAVPDAGSFMPLADETEAARFHRAGWHVQSRGVTPWRDWQPAQEAR